MISDARECFETKFYGTILVSQAFAPILAKNGGGAIINVAVEHCELVSRRMLSAYSALKSMSGVFRSTRRVLRTRRISAGLMSRLMVRMLRNFKIGQRSPRRLPMRV